MPRSSPASGDEGPERHHSLDGRPQGALSPRRPADYLAPNIDYMNPPKHRPSLNRATVVSQLAHMKYSASTATMNINIGNPNTDRGHRVSAEDNIPTRFDAFLLGDGEKKVTEEPDTRKS